MKKLAFDGIFRTQNSPTNVKERTLYSCSVYPDFLPKVYLSLRLHNKMLLKQIFKNAYNLESMQTIFVLEFLRKKLKINFYI